MVLAGLAALAAPVVVAPAPASAAPGDVVLVSRGPAGGAGGDADSSDGNISRDGSKVVFTSAAQNLLPASTPLGTYLRDVGTDGLVRTATQMQHSDISPDGTRAFLRTSGGRLDAFNVASQTTFTASRCDTDEDATGSLSVNGPLASTSSADGVLVAFNARPPPGDLTCPGTAGLRQTFVRNLTTHGTMLASVGATTDVRGVPALSANGRYVAFGTTDAIVAADTNGAEDVYVRDLVGGTTTLASRADGAAGAGADAEATSADISADGRFVAFTTRASNLGTAVPAGQPQVWLRDMAAGTTELISRADGPFVLPPGGGATAPSISDDGRLVSFVSSSTTLVSDPPIVGSASRAYVRDRVTGGTKLASRDPGNGAAATVSTTNGDIPRLSGDGRFIVFTSFSPGLSPDDNNSVRNVYRRELELPTGPGVSINSGPVGTVATTDASFGFTAADPPPGHYECSLDGTSFAACVSPQAYSGLADGPHTFRVRYTPDGGAGGPVSERTWTVDTTAPKVIVDSAPTGSANGPSAQFSFHADEANVVFSCSLDGRPAAPCTSPHSVTGLADGGHTLLIVATDAVGNSTTPPVTVSWGVAGCPAGRSLVPGLRQSPSCSTFKPQPEANCKAPRQSRVSAGAFVLYARSADACFERSENTWVSTGTLVTMNGLPVYPRGGKLVLSDQSDGSVEFPKGAGIELIPGGLVPIPFSFTMSGTAGTIAGTELKLWNAFWREQTKPKKPDKPAVVDLGVPPFVVAPTFEFSRVANGSLTLGLRFELPWLFRGDPFIGEVPKDYDRGKSGGVTFEGRTTYSNDKGQSVLVRVALEHFYLGSKDGPVIRDASGSYELKPDGEWRADLGATLYPFGDGNDKGKYGFPVSFSIGRKPKAPKYDIQIGAAITRLNIPLGDGFFWQRIGLSFGRLVKFDLDKEADTFGRFELSGGISFLPREVFPRVFEGELLSFDGSGGTTFRLHGPYLGGHSVEMKGTFRVLEQATIADGFYKMELQPKLSRVEMGGRLEIPFGLGKYTGRVEGWVQPPYVDPKTKSLVIKGAGYNFEGSGDLSLLGFGTISRASALMSLKGWAVCVSIGGAQAGVSQETGESVNYMAGSCDVGTMRFRGIGNPRAAGAATSVTIPSGRKIAVIAARGADAPPKIVVEGPGGRRIVTPDGPGATKVGDTLLVQDAARRTTLVALGNPRGGNYTVSPLPGTPSPVAVGLADELPPISIRGSVSGRGASRVFRWRMKAQPGQSVVFSEVTSAGGRPLAVTSKADGSVSFVPGAGENGVRRIEALVLQDDRPRDRITVATFRAGPPKLSRVRGIRRARKKLVWRAVAGATGYVVAVQQRAKPETRVVRNAKRPALTLPSSMRRGAITVVVAARQELGADSAPTVAEIKR